MDGYIAGGGYEAITKALKEMQPSDVIREVNASGLRGRGGGGFPAGKKWKSVLDSSKKREQTRYVVCNAAEGEPGTYKDRSLIRSNPHQLIEGVILASYAIGAHEAYIYVNSHEGREGKILETALAEAGEKGFTGNNILGSSFNLVLKLFNAPDSYVAGEETAMLEVIEGKTAKPRMKPPYYPFQQGLFGQPTLVNNAETLSNIPHIIRHGGEWFSLIGSAESPGTMLFTLTGDIKMPGVYEAPLGTSLRSLIYDCGGGMKEGKEFKAAFPGGPSVPMVRKLDIAMDFDSLRKAGSALGSGGVIVYAADQCMVKAALETARFFKEGSCGLCPPCVKGPAQLVAILERIEEGKGEVADLRSIEEICHFIRGRGYCYLVTGAALSTASIFTAFKPEFKTHISNKKCPFKGH